MFIIWGDRLMTKGVATTANSSVQIGADQSAYISMKTKYNLPHLVNKVFDPSSIP